MSLIFYFTYRRRFLEVKRNFSIPFFLELVSMIESFDSVCDPPGSTYEKIETWTFLHHVVGLWILFDIMFKLDSDTSTLGRKGGTSLSLGEARIPDSLLVSVDTQLEGNSLSHLASLGTWDPQLVYTDSATEVQR